MKTCYRLRAVSAVLSIITIISLVFLTFPSFAVPDGASPKSAVLSKYLSSAESIAEAENWITLEGSNSGIISDSDGKAIRVQSRSASASAQANFSDGIKIGDNKEAGIIIRSLSGTKYSVTFTVYHDAGASTVTSEMSPYEEYYIFTPLAESAQTITGISFIASSVDDDSSVSVIVRNAVLSKENHSDNAKKYSAFNVEKTDFLSETTNTHISAGPILLSDYSSNYAIKITLSGSSGGINVHYSSDSENYGVCGSTVITEGRNEYLFHVGKVTLNSAYKIEFTGTDNSQSPQVEKVEFIPVKLPDISESLGTVSKCTFADNTVTVTGSITRDAAVKYIDGEVCLYEVPIWMDAEAVLAGDPADTIKMSTSFSFTHYATKDHASLSSYIIAIRDKKGVYPLSDPIFPASNFLPEVRDTVSAVAGISPEQAFAAGFDNYVIDIDITTLFLEKSGSNSTVFTHDGLSYFSDKEVTAAIERKKQFLSAAGVGVIFRLKSPLEDSLDLTDEYSCRIFSAAISYLWGRFSPYGFILECITDNNRDISLSDRAYDTAAAIRLASVSAGEKAVIYMPVDHSDESEPFVWLLSEYISDMPKANWEILLTNIPDNDVSYADVIMVCAIDGGYSSQITLSVNSSAESPVDTTARSYITEAEDGVLSHVPDNEWERRAVISEWNGAEENTISLWDFTNSYDSGGFTVPAGPTGILTETNDALESFTGIPACRSLKTVLGSDSEVIIAQPTSPMRLTDSPFVRFLFACETETPFSMDIVFISENERLVFTAEFDGSGVYLPVCDLSDTNISQRIDRIALVLHDGEKVELAIASITASGEKTAREIQNTVYITDPSVTTPAPVLPEEQTNDNSSEMFVAAGALLIVTVITFAVLSIKKPQ